MKKHDDRDYDVDNYGNEDGNDDESATSGSGSNGPIFDPITTTWSHLSLSEEYLATTKTALRPRHTIYLHIGIYLPYKQPVNTIVNMCHKLLYTKIGVLELC